MGDLDRQGVERLLDQAAAEFPYPSTPDMVERVSARLSGRPSLGVSRYRLAWVLALFVILLTGALAVPPVRAAVLEWIQIGAIRIFLGLPEVTPTLPGLESPAGSLATAQPVYSLPDLAGEVSLDEVERLAGYSVRLPSYPPDLGPPDRVYFQHLGGPSVLLIWLVEGTPEQVHLSLLQLGPNSFASKGAPAVMQETRVGEYRAQWMEGDHILLLQVGETQQVVELDVEGNVLIWEAEGITYRLEGHMELEQALLIAESLFP